jgi:hypothetical protein
MFIVFISGENLISWSLLSWLVFIILQGREGDIQLRLVQNIHHHPKRESSSSVKERKKFLFNPNGRREGLSKKEMKTDALER